MFELEKKNFEKKLEERRVSSLVKRDGEWIEELRKIVVRLKE